MVTFSGKEKSDILTDGRHTNKSGYTRGPAPGGPIGNRAGLRREGVRTMKLHKQVEENPVDK
jgi:hypothetical protein